MLPSPRKLLRRSAALAVLCTAAPLSPALAGDINLTTLWIGDEDTLWQNYTYLSQDVVHAANDISAELTMQGDAALGLQDQSAWLRLGYLLTAGQLNARIQWANSVMAHEGAHFQHAHRFGFDRHYFVDDETREEVDNLQAWWNAFLYGSVGGPATSSPSDPARVDSQAYAAEGIMASNAGVNWQMAYSERWNREWMGGAERNAFQATDFLINRMFLSTYAFGDLQADAPNAITTGDLTKFGEHISGPEKGEDTVREIAMWSIGANLLSPAYWQAVNGVVNYVATGETEMGSPFFETSAGGFTWDVPQYLNLDGFALAPTVYWKPKAEVAEAVWADELVFGAGVEVPVVGSGPTELRASVLGKWGPVGVDLSVSGAEGVFASGEVSYAVTDRAAITAGFAVGDGDSLRGMREMPTGDQVAWAGFRISF